MKKIVEKNEKFIKIGLLFLVVLCFPVFYSFFDKQDRILCSYSFPFYGLIILFNVFIFYHVYQSVLEYQVSGHYKNKVQFFKLYHLYVLFAEVFSFLFFYCVFPLIFQKLFKNAVSASLLNDILLIFKMTVVTSLVQPFLSMYRGYFKGHHIERVVICSYIIEIVGGIFASFLGVKVFSFPYKLFNPLIGFLCSSFFAFLFLILLKYRYKSKFEEKIRKVNEPIHSDKSVLKKIHTSFLPYYVVALMGILYYFVDTNSFLISLKVDEKFSLYADYAVWSMIFHVLLIIASLGVVKRVIENMNSVEKKSKYVLIYKILIFSMLLAIPFSFLISFLAKPIWILFYGIENGYHTLSYSIFSGLFFSLYIGIVFFFQYLKLHKPIFISFMIGLVLKFLLTNQLMEAFYQSGFPADYGIVTGSMVVFLVLFIYFLFVFHFQYHTSFEILLKSIMDIVCSSVIMMIILLLLKFIIPFSSKSVFVNFLLIAFYSMIGIFSYLMGIHFVKLRDKILYLEKHY